VVLLETFWLMMFVQIALTWSIITLFTIVVFLAAQISLTAKGTESEGDDDG